MRRTPGKFPVQFPPGIAIMSARVVYSRRGQSPCWAGGQEAGHDRQAGVPDHGNPACLFRVSPNTVAAPWPKPLADPHRGPSVAEHRASTARAGSSGTDEGCRKFNDRCGTATSPRHGAGPAGAPLAQANQSPPGIDYGTESVVISHTTSARAQCKGPVGRSSCEIAAGGRAVSPIRSSEAIP